MQIIEKSIIYDEPEISMLRASGNMCFDMHIHTNYSDGMNSVSEVLETAKDLGIGISITDHNEIKGSLYAKRLIDKNKNFSNIFLIPGIEVTVKENYHVLVYFTNFEDLSIFYLKAIKPFLNVNTIRTKTNIVALDMIKCAREFDSLIFLAHPFVITGIFVSGKGDHTEILSEVDGFEIINGCIPESSNLKAIRWQNNFGNLNFCAGSDSHFKKFIGSSLTCTNNKIKSIKDYFNTIRNRKHKIIGKSVIPKDLVVNHLFFYRLMWNKLKNTEVIKKISS